MATYLHASSIPTNSRAAHAPTSVTSSADDGTKRQDEDTLGFGGDGSSCLASAVIIGACKSSSPPPPVSSSLTTHYQKKRKVDGCGLDPRLMGSEELENSLTSRRIEELSRPSLDHFPNSDLLVPMPAFEFDFRIAVTLDPELSRSENRVDKEVITVTGGKWSGTFGNGRVLAGGYDLTRASGFGPIRIVEGAFVLQTADTDPTILQMCTRGSLSDPCNLLDVLLRPRKAKDIDPCQYSFHMFCTVKAADKRYTELVNYGMWVASGVWMGDELIIDAFRIT